MGGKRKGPARTPRIDAAAKVAMLAALREGRRPGAVAAAYGVTLQAFYSARRRDPLFAAAWPDAHALSAEAERRPVEPADSDEAHIASNNRRLLRLEAQARLWAAMEEAEARGAKLPPEAEGVEFDRTMKLLARWDRRDGRLGPREVRHGRQQSMSFVDSIELLDRKLRSLGVRTDVPPPEAGQGDGDRH
jgi:hypothetical protein